MRTVRTSRRIALCAAACLLAGTVGAGTAWAAPSDYAFEAASASVTTSAAGAHPDFNTLVKFTQEPEPPNAPYGRTRDLSFELPRGLVGNPTNVTQCSAAEFPPDFGNALASCPQESQVGVTHVELSGESNEIYTPVYALRPPAEGDIVARLGFIAVFFPVYIDVHVRAASDYGLTATVTTPPSQLPLIKADTTLWGVPASHSHDSERFSYAESFFCGGPCGGGRESGLPPAPFLSNPTSCGPQSVGMAADSYLEPERVITATAPLPDVVECDRVSFEPSLRVTPTNPTAGEPTGLEADLRIPQDENAEGVSSSELRSASVTLPQGMAINPSAADGLAACDASQVGYGTDGAADCPNAAKIGSATVISPSLSRPLSGAIYQRTPQAGDLFRLWLVTDEQGVHLKLPGEVRADPNTGQLTATFAETPQLPAEEIKLEFKGGARAPLRNPSDCGTYASHYGLAPWSGGPTVTGETPMEIDRGCDASGFDPGFNAGVSNPVAGLHSPLAVNLIREDSEPNVSRLDVSLPPGELAKLAGVEVCAGTSAANGACPPGSQVGSLDVAVGAGTLPFWMPQPGKAPTAIYLGGPYEGQPYSLVFVVPAQAGPFDLGTVVTRAAIHVDPETTQVTVRSDPLPQILEGVPVTYRRIHAAIDRPDFALNPTSCEASSTAARIFSTAGQLSTQTSRFQVGSCGQLRFKPRLFIRLTGATRRGGNPKLRAVLLAHEGEANIRTASVALPHSEFLDNAHIGTVCTRVQFAAERCPKHSIYGWAVAKTPLLDRPLRGHVYLRSSNHRLPDLVADLRGQIRVVLDGRIDSIHGGIRTVFASVPDAPVSKFVITMAGGRRSLLENSTNLCRGSHRARVKLLGHHGRVDRSSPLVKPQCGKDR
jgi:hypothetical protein